MAAKTISQSQLHAINNGSLDLIGESKSSYSKVNLKDLTDTLAYLGARYALEMQKALKEVNASSSGQLADSIIPLDVEVFGSLYTVSISALKYAQFINEGIDGWAKSRGSRFKFKTKGVDPKGEMVKSVHEWINREGSFARIKVKPTTLRESRQSKITDVSLKAAITTSYMIKRQGIKPTHFLEIAKERMKLIIKKELTTALKVDIINNLN
jgi:hypothetical protein